MIERAIRTDAAGADAICSAISRTVASSSSAGTSRDTIPYRRNSADFVFDSQFLVQCVHRGFKLGDVPVPVRYFDEASSINLRNSTIYACRTLWTFAQWYGHRIGLRNELFA